MNMKQLPAVLILAGWPACSNAETVTFTWTPETEDEAQTLRLGLALHSLWNDVHVQQSGQEHTARISQSGHANQATVVQRGRRHTATVVQSEGGNALLLFQIGRGGLAEIGQAGGAAGVAVQLSASWR